MIDITEILKLKNTIDIVQARIIADKEFVAKYCKELQNLCTHPTVTTTRKYYGGGYDYLSSIRITTKCTFTLCEKILETYDDPKHQGQHG